MYFVTTKLSCRTSRVPKSSELLANSATSATFATLSTKGTLYFLYSALS